jgi:hypothetical protein
MELGNFSYFLFQRPPFTWGGRKQEREDSQNKELLKN